MAENNELIEPNPSPQTAFIAFKRFVSRFHPIDILSQLTLTFLFTPDTQFIGEASATRHWARWIEFTAGYLASQPVTARPFTKFEGPAIDEFEKLIDQYFNSIPLHLLMNREPISEPSLADRVLISAKIYSLYVRGDAYPHQFLEYASELYSEHDEWFTLNLGFTIDDAIRIAKAIPAELERRVNDSMSKARREAPQRATEYSEAAEAAGLSSRELEDRIICQLHFGAASELLGFTPEQIAAMSGVDTSASKSFLRRMSQPFGYRNPNFPDTFADATKAPWDYNCVDERPFLEHEGTYWLFTNSMFSSVLFYTFYFDLMADQSYRPKFEATRGAFVEVKVRDYLTRVFPHDAVLLNPSYPNGEEFSDVAVLHDGKILVFQCKAKGFTRNARIGTDFAQLRADMQAAIRAAFDQASRARTYIRSSDEAILKTEQAELHIQTKQVIDIYLVNVTLMPFQAMTTRFENIEEALGLFPEREYPFSIALGDLDIVTQILDSPARFLHYVNRRLDVEKTKFNLHADELDLLGFYLDQGMYFSGGTFDEANDLSLNGFSEEIDEFVHRKYDKGENVTRPQSPMPPGFLQLIADIESLDSMYRTDCAIALLDMSGSARSKLMDLIDKAKFQSRTDNKSHSISMGSLEHSRGWSFVTVTEATSQQTIFDAALSLALLKKYAEKSQEWFGLGWRLGSMRSVDAAVTIKFPWQKDEGMESAVKQFLRPGLRTDLKDTVSQKRLP